MRYTVLLAFLLALAAEAASGATWYVNNVVGADAYDGTSAVPDGMGHGPVATLAAAAGRLRTSDRLEIANTGKSYRGGLALNHAGGTPEAPLVVDGHGATIDGLDVVPASAWQTEADGTLSIPFLTYANKIEADPAVTTWISRPQIWFVDGKPAPNAVVRNVIPPGGFYWQKSIHRLYFRPPAGRRPADLRVEVPTSTGGVSVYTDWVIVRNLRAIHSLNDGFGAIGARNVLFQHITAEDNCDQGFSAHVGSLITIEDAVFTGNAGSGVCDVHNSVTIYRRCVISDNAFEVGAYFQDDGFHLLQDCRIERNADGPQVLASGRGPVHLINCLIQGKEGSPAPLVLARAPAILDGCTVSNGLVGVRVEETGGLRLTNSVLSGCAEALVSIAAGAELLVVSDCNVFNLGVLVRAGKRYAIGEWDTYRKESGQDAQSLAAPPGSAPHVLFKLPIPSALRTPEKDESRPPGVNRSRLPKDIAPTDKPPVVLSRQRGSRLQCQPVSLDRRASHR
jgi:hypothetical protein